MIVPYTCFVICPFGSDEKGRKEAKFLTDRMGLRKHVFDRVEAICRQLGREVSIEDATQLRLSSGPSQDSVRDQVAARIDSADAILLLATSLTKPNIWLELGWADGFWHEAVFLRRSNFKLPADLEGKICEHFTDRQIEGRDEAGAEALAQRLARHILAKIEKRREERFKHFRESTLAVGKIRFYNRFSKAISFEEWSSVLQDAREQIVMASPRMLDVFERPFFWTNPDGSRTRIAINDLLLQKSLMGVQVTVMMQHPDNYADHHVVQSSTLTPLQIRASLSDSYDRWASVVTAYRQSRRTAESQGVEFKLPIEDGFRVVQIHTRYLPYRVTFTDRRAITTLRFYTEAVNSGLCIDATPSPIQDMHNRPFYAQIKEEIEFLISANKQYCEESYQDHLQRKMLL